MHRDAVVLSSFLLLLFLLLTGCYAPPSSARKPEPAPAHRPAAGESWRGWEMRRQVEQAKEWEDRAEYHYRGWSPLTRREWTPAPEEQAAAEGRVEDAFRRGLFRGLSCYRGVARLYVNGVDTEGDLLALLAKEPGYRRLIRDAYLVAFGAEEAGRQESRIWVYGRRGYRVYREEVHHFRPR